MMQVFSNQCPVAIHMYEYIKIPIYTYSILTFYNYFGANYLVMSKILSIIGRE